MKWATSAAPPRSSPATSRFIAERSIYWGAGGWVEGTNVIGSPSAAPEWHVPEGTETGDFDSFLLILNPTGAAVTVDVDRLHRRAGTVHGAADMRPVIAARARARRST